jgi:hypothetical protein
MEIDRLRDRVAALEAAGDVAAAALVEADGALVFLEACGDAPRWRQAQHARITATNARFVWRAARHGMPGGEEGGGGR